VAPFIGPVIDRIPGGRRITVFIVAVLRCVTVILMISRLNSISLFALAFISLVLARTYSVSKTAIVPSLVKSDDELVSANSRLGLLSGAMGFAAAIPAALLQLFDARATLVMSAVMFGLAGFASLQLPRHVATTPKVIEKIEIEELRSLQVRRIAFSMMLLRGMIGFLFFHVAFWLRDESAGTAWFGLGLGLSSLAIMIGNFIAPYLRRQMSERAMMLFVFLIIGVIGIYAGVVGGITAGIILISVTNGMGSVGRLAFESVVQREAPDANRARAFVKFETLNQLAWVGLGLVAVILTLPGAVGFGVVGFVCMAGSVYLFLNRSS
ncbi:MAG: MFS transporter, partial [Actinomycetota bacterium]|nr:MFS transporter [Actinomycetota bacterium]